jgi:putative tricarboxylic transport membrane protein
MIEAALQALAALVEPARLLMLLAGVGVGLVVGIVPGLSGTVGMSLLLPFIYGMDAASALALLIGMAAVVHTADTYPSVLLGIPGSSGSQATILDGYPLARRGEAGRALSAAFFSSMIGGVLGAIALFAILPVARPLVTSLRSPELFMLTVLGLSMVGVLSGRRPLLGVTAALIGLLIGTIGAAPAVPHYRYTFGSLYLFDGIPLAVVALGLFAVPELLHLLVRRERIAEVARVGSGWRTGLADVIRHRWLVVRCSVVGVGVGMIPGLGGSVVDWLSYGQAVQTSKDRSRFGHGDIRGVIAPESSNNAKEAGALVPTLLFGIPGSGTTAVLLGGFVLIGLQPGPRMLTANLDVTLTIIWVLALANVIGALACLAPSRVIALLSRIEATKLAPVLLVVLLLGAYQSTRHWGDLLAFLAIGLLGWLMKIFDWPRPPLLIGFVLAVAAERYLWISWSRYGWSWLAHPGVLIIGALTVALVVAGMRLRDRVAAAAPAPDTEPAAAAEVDRVR